MAGDENLGTKRLKKELNETQTIVNEQAKRLSSLQSNGFNLANFFLVFQGVILAAVANGSSVFTCLDCWLLIGVSALAVYPNLVSLYLIGQEYIAIITQRDASHGRCLELNAQLSRLQAQPQLSSLQAQPPANETPPSDQRGDDYRKCKRQFLFYVCMACFAGVSVIMATVSVRTLCVKVAEPKNPLKLNVKCIRFCQGSKCMRCSEY